MELFGIRNKAYCVLAGIKIILSSEYLNKLLKEKIYIYLPCHYSNPCIVHNFDKYFE